MKIPIHILVDSVTCAMSDGYDICHHSHWLLMSVQVIGQNNFSYR